MNALTPQQIFGRRLKEVREKRGISQRELVEQRLASLGHKLSQAAVTRIERGERKVSLADAIALAAAFDIAPVHLFLPIDNSERVALTPGCEVPADVARQWALGLRPLDPVNTRSYASESPPVPDWEHIQVQRQEDFGRDAAVIPAEQELTEQEEDRPPPTPRSGP